MKKTITLDNVR